MVSNTVTIKPNHKAIQHYYETLQSYADLNQTHETGVRTAFIRLLEDTAKLQAWTLVTEVGQKVEGRTIRPDATLYKSAVPRGYYEAKDTKDDLDGEIRKKSAKGYPLTNIIFEDTRQAVLYQNRQEAYRATDLKDPEQLAHLLSTFYAYTEPVLDNYDQALEQFNEQVPQLARGLVHIIEAAHTNNKRFIAAFETFYELCKTSLNPNIARPAVDEMLVQHLLTERLIRKIFDNPEFTRRNVIAAEIEKVIDALVSQSFNRDEFLRSLDSFYQAIESAAHGLEFSQKQTLLNEVYERFFQGYSIKIADTHGIVYTPQPIVDFMCASVIEVLQTEFGKTLGDEDVVILDPATGTGNFIVNLLRRANKADLPQLYNERLFANEIMLLPYYIAALNIEHAYYELTGQYESFEGLCFVDTLDLAEGQQMSFSFMTEKNTERVERQKKAPITVIIGNPPYNVGQVNENDNNKNRKYAEIDNQIRETYAKESRATNKNALSDVYVKFFKWATSRLEGRDGIVCYVSNNSFVDQIAFDGMRKRLLNDFTRIYHIDLHGNVRQNPKLSGTTHNVFGIQVGVGITLAIKASKHSDHKIFYHRVPEFWRKDEKLAWLGQVGGVQALRPSPLTPLPQGEGNQTGRGELSRAEGDQGKGTERGETRQGEGKLGSKTADGERYRVIAAKAIVEIGRDLRQRQTEAEVLLWEYLRDRRLENIKFRRQHPVPETPYVVDFYSHEARLIIELDGPIHDTKQQADANRQEILESLGYTLIRFSNDQVFNKLESVLTKILIAYNALITSKSASSSPRPAGEGLGVRATMIELTPDSRHNWRGTKHGYEFATLLPMGEFNTKETKGFDGEAIFKTYGRGLETTRDSWVYDYDTASLAQKITRLIETYNSEIDRWRRANKPSNVDNFVLGDETKIKWSSRLKETFSRELYAHFEQTKVRTSLYRPFTRQFVFFDLILNQRVGIFPEIFPVTATEQENCLIWLKVGSEWPMFALISNHIVDLLPQGGSQCFPFYTYDPDGSNRRENITDWALSQFRTHYGDDSITKWDIFYYVYGILHHPGYREKFADNLKRELPRIPFAMALTPNPSPCGTGEREDGLVGRGESGFWAFAQAGQQLAELHLNYETVTPYKLKWFESKDMPLSYHVDKMRLNKDKTALKVNDFLTLADIPPETYQYRLGNRSALEWVIDQYQVSEDKRSGIKSDPNREDEPRYIVDLVGRVVAVSLETVKIVEALPEQYSAESEG